MKPQPNQLAYYNPRESDAYLVNPYPAGFEKVDLPAASIGDWSIAKVTLTKDQLGLYNLRLIRDGYPRRIVPPGDYTRLVNRHVGIVMSDTPAEAHDHKRALALSSGNVLINGLGLGMFLDALLRKPEVEHVTVIELSPEVIKMVGRKYQKNPRVTIINANALTYKPDKGKRFNFVWHDIWPDICADNRKQMTALKRKYGRLCDRQACWSEEYLRP